MEQFLLGLHIVLCFVVVIVVLLQSGKGGGLGAGFNNAAALGQEVFGGRGAAGFLVKLTVVVGTAFMITSMALAWYSSKPQSALDLDIEADDPVDAVTHEIVYEGGGDAPDPAGGQMEQQIELDGEDGEFDLEQLLGDDAEDSNLELEFDEQTETPEELREGLQEGLELDMEPGDDDAMPEPEQSEQPAESEEPAEPAEIEEPAEPAEPAESEEPDNE